MKNLDLDTINGDFYEGLQIWKRRYDCTFVNIDTSFDLLKLEEVYKNISIEVDVVYRFEDENANYWIEEFVNKKPTGRFGTPVKYGKIVTFYLMC